MSRAIKRKITVLNEEYLWVLNGNSIDEYHQEHIRIYRNNQKNNILYLDPYNYNFEIRPKTIEKAILIANEKGWQHLSEGKAMYLAMNNEGDFYELPEGEKFTK